MRWSRNFLTFGVLCIIAGIILLIIGSGTTGNSTFFVFPFFFFSTSEPLGIFMFLALTLLIVVLMIRTISEVSYRQEAGEMSSWSTKCVYCSSPVPRGASFCPTCGNALNDDSITNE